MAVKVCIFVSIVVFYVFRFRFLFEFLGYGCRMLVGSCLVVKVFSCIWRFGKGYSVVTSCL